MANDIQHKLREWGQWLIEYNKKENGYPKSTSFYRAQYGSRSTTIFISNYWPNHELNMLNELVFRLPNLQKHAIINNYFWGFRKIENAKILKISRPTLDKYLKKAEETISYQYQNNLHTLHKLSNIK